MAILAKPTTGNKNYVIKSRSQGISCICDDLVIRWHIVSSAAKHALIGLSNTLAIEGARNNIHCNCIVPTAASRLTKDILPENLYNELSE